MTVLRDGTTVVCALKVATCCVFHSHNLKALGCLKKCKTRVGKQKLRLKNLHKTKPSDLCTHSPHTTLDL